MDGTQFYTSNNLDKYPNDGKLPKCKKCITMHVDNWNPDTYLWILQECDVPYIPEQWNQLMGKFAKDRTKVTGMTILGRYLSNEIKSMERLQMERQSVLARLTK